MTDVEITIEKPDGTELTIPMDVGEEIDIQMYEQLRVTGKTTPREELITGVAGLIREEGWHQVVNDIAGEVTRQEEA